MNLQKENVVNTFNLTHMNNFKHLDDKTIELAGISASIAGGCRPCLDYHYKRAIEIGCTVEQVKEAIELGKMIKQRPINDIYEHAEKLMNTNNQSFKIL